MKKPWAPLLLALLLALCACAGTDKEAEEGGYLLYFLASGDAFRGDDKVQGVYEPLELAPDASLRDTARAVVERLLAGPRDGDLTSPIPAGVELLGLEIRDRRAYVDLSGAYSQLEGIDLAMADYCLTLSLTALEGVSSVSVTAGGRSLGQQPKQVFSRQDVLLSAMDDVLKTVDVTLYFLGGDNALTGETRTLALYEGQTLADSLVSALLEGPQDRELTRVIPEDFQINFVRVENGVCSVSISAASLEALPEDQRQQELILWSLADSLYSMESVSELRLFSGGEELTLFGSVPVETVAVRPAG